MTKARDLANAGTALTSVDATELGYLDGVTSAVQTQLDAKVASSTIDAKGDLIAGSADNTVVKLTAGANGLYLAADSSTTSGLVWTTVASGSVNGSVNIPIGSALSRTLTYSFTTGIYNVTIQGPVISFTVGGTTVTKQSSATQVAAESQMVTLPSTSSASMTLSEIWISRSSGITDGFVTAAIGGGLYLLAGSLNRLRTSTDSITWTSRNSSFTTTSDITSVIYGDGIYVLGATSGQLSTSTNGTTWTTRSVNFGTSRVVALLYANSLYVAGGEGGKLSTSTDAITWTSRTSTFGTTTIQALTFGNGVYVAGGLTGTLRTSTNAITWTSRTSGFGTTHIFALAYGNGIYVAGGDDGILTTSTNGITWTARTSGFSPGDIYRLVYGNNLFTAVGESGRLSTSTDGITWTNRASSAGFGSQPIEAIGYDGVNSYIIGGGNGTIRVRNAAPDETTFESFINWNLSETVSLD